MSHCFSLSIARKSTGGETLAAKIARSLLTQPPSPDQPSVGRPSFANAGTFLTNVAVVGSVGVSWPASCATIKPPFSS